MIYNKFKEVSGHYFNASLSSPEAIAGQSEVLLTELGFVKNMTNWVGQNVYNSYWRLYYNQQAGHIIGNGDQRIEMKPNCIYLIPSEQLFHFDSNHCQADHLYIHFYYNRVLALQQQIPIACQVDPLRQTLIERLCQSLQKEEKNERQLLHYSLALVLEVLTDSQLQWNPDLPATIQQAQTYIDKNIRRPIKIADIIRECGLSRESLHLKFSQYLNISPGQYIIRRKMSQACHELIFTQKSIDEIAEDLGYSNRHYFSRLFNTHLQCGPATYRKRNKRYK